MIAFNLQYSNGYPINFHEVQKLAQMQHIHLRTGCFCNLGACQAVFGLSGQSNEENYRLGRICSHDDDTIIPVDIINHKNTGACRISFSYGSTKDDIDKFLHFLKTCFLNQLPASPSIPLMLPPPPTHRAASNKESKSDKEDGSTAEKDLFWHHDVYSFPFLHSTTSTQPLHKNHTHQSVRKVAALFVYPIKSCAGVRVDNWPVLYGSQKFSISSSLMSTGLLYDRYFAIVDENGKVLSQKQHPAMALIQPTFHLHQDGDDNNSSQLLVLHLTAPTMDSILEVPLQASNSIGNNSSDMEFRVCGRRTMGKKVSHDADAWITTFLNMTKKPTNGHDNANIQLKGKIEKSFYLIRASLQQDESSASNKVTTTGNSTESSVSTFANTAQYLMLSMASVRALIQVSC